MNNPELERKCELLAKNYRVCTKSAKLDMTQAASLAALIFTARDIEANEQRIRECRKILKKKTGPFNNMRGHTNLALLSKMAIEENPEAYLDKVLRAYNFIKAGKILTSEYMTMAAQVMADNARESDFKEIADQTHDLIDMMSKQHLLLTTYQDIPMATALVMSDVDTLRLFEESERCFQALKGTGFKLNKDTLQTISHVLALSDQPTEVKCEKFVQIRTALKQTGHPIRYEELAIVSALVALDVPVQTIVEEICDADNYLKKKRGFGAFSAGRQLRRLYAAALVLQVHKADAGQQAENVAHIVVQHIIEVIVLSITYAAIRNASRSHTSSS